MGTRRKARECALQMLFAADVTGTNGSVLVRRYWSEYGYNELFENANTLIGGFNDDLALVLSNLTDVNRAASSKRTAGYVKEVKDKNKEIQAAYKKFVDKLIGGDSPSTEDIDSLLKDFHTAVKRAESEIIAEAKFTVSGSENSDLSSSPAIEQIEKTLEKLFKTTLPQLDAMVKNTAHSREFTDRLTLGTLREIEAIDDRIRTRAEHWRIERMAIVDRNVLRLAVYEFLFDETPHTVVINEALEIARMFSTFEATQFINGILDAIKHDLDKKPTEKLDRKEEKTHASTN